MSAAMFMTKEQCLEIPSPKESWRKLEMQLVASDYEILWCLQKLSQPVKPLSSMKVPGLVTGIEDPYNIDIDEGRIDTILEQYKNSFFNFDYLYSKDENQSARAKKELKNLLCNYLPSHTTRLWLDKSDINMQASVSGDPTSGNSYTVNYTVTINGEPVGTNRTGRRDPSSIDITITDEINEREDQDHAKLPVTGKLTVNYPGQNSNDNQPDESQMGRKSEIVYDLYVNRSPIPRIVVDGTNVYPKEVYLSEDAKINGEIAQAYTLYRIHLLMRQVIAPAMLSTGAFNELVYTHSGEGYTRVTKEAISAQIEEVLGEAAQYEIVNIIYKILTSLANPVNDEVLVSTLLPPLPLDHKEEGHLIRNDMRNIRTHPEKVRNYAGMRFIINDIAEFIGSDVSRGIPIVSALVVHIMHGLINSKPDVAAMIEELESDMKTINERILDAGSTPPTQQPFFYKATKIVRTILERAKLLDSVEEEGLEAIHSLRENPSSENLLSTLSTLKFSKLRELARKEARSLNYSDVSWDMLLDEGTWDRNWIFQWSKSGETQGASYNELYVYCCRRTNCETQEGQIDEAVFTGTLDEQGSSSSVPLVAEMNRYERDRKREIDRLQNADMLAEAINSAVGGRI